MYNAVNVGKEWAAGSVLVVGLFLHTGMNCAEHVLWVSYAFSCNNMDVRVCILSWYESLTWLLFVLIDSVPWELIAHVCGCQLSNLPSWHFLLFWVFRGDVSVGMPHRGVAELCTQAPNPNWWDWLWFYCHGWDSAWRIAEGSYNAGFAVYHKSRYGPPTWGHVYYWVVHRGSAMGLVWSPYYHVLQWICFTYADFVISDIGIV